MRDVAFFGRVPICGDELMKYSVKRALRLLSGYAILQTPHNVEAQPIGAPGFSSASVIPRPKSGVTPSPEKYWPVTITPSASVGSPFMPTVVFWSLKPSGTNAKTLDITFCWALNSLNSSYENEKSDSQPVIEKCGGHLSLSHWKRTRCRGSLTGRDRSMIALMR